VAPQAEVVASVLLAGLYPQVACVELVRGPRSVADPSKVCFSIGCYISAREGGDVTAVCFTNLPTMNEKDLRIECSDGVEAFLVKTSMAFGPGRGPLRPARDGSRERFVVYGERLKTWKVFLRLVYFVLLQ